MWVFCFDSVAKQVHLQSSRDDSCLEKIQFYLQEEYYETDRVLPHLL